MSYLPNDFIEKMKVILPMDFEQFEAALKSAPPTSIRLNPLKITREKLSHLPLEKQVPWHPDAFYLTSRPSFTFDPLFHAGAYYVQEASSMLLHDVLTQLIPTTTPLRILDLCAAPGGKSTLLAAWMPQGSLLVANEVIKSRVATLKENLLKWGHSDVFTCSYDPESFLPLAGWFDLVLVDAPCSGEGLFRKNSQSSHAWTPENVELCAARQRRILSVAQKLVAPGGTLVYSTCTYNTSENDRNAEWLVRTRAMTPRSIDFPPDWGLTSKPIGYQAYPHRVRGEGYYLAAFQNTRVAPTDSPKKNRGKRFSKKYQPLSRSETNFVRPWIGQPDRYRFVKNQENTVFHLPAEFEEEVGMLHELLPEGVWLHRSGQIKGNELIPSHLLAMQAGTLPTDIPRIELTAKSALSYLKKELPALSEAKKGWNIVTYNGLPLGWIRNFGNRINNYFPTEQRIKLDLPKDNI